jgi:Glycosyl transferase family 2.
MKRRMVVMTPTYENYDEQTKDSIRRTMEEIQDVQFVFLRIAEVYIHAARRKLLQRALEMHRENKFDYFLWLDSDVTFEPKHMQEIIKCIDKGLNAVTGIYFSRHGNNNPMLCMGNPYDGYNFIIKKTIENWKMGISIKHYLL